MEESSAVREALEWRLAAFRRRDLDAIEELSCSEVTFIGTDPGEYTRGADELIEALRGVMPSVPAELELGSDDIHAYEHGDVGWADCVGRFVAGDDAVPVRMTSVLLRDAGQWKIIQTHISIGVPNGHMFAPLFQAAATA